jgi:hypothetical protein
MASLRSDGNNDDDDVVGSNAREYFLLQTNFSDRQSSRRDEPLDFQNKTKQTPWSEYASELYRPSDRRLSAK